VTDGELILAAGVLLAASVAAALAAQRLRLPALLLFLAIGMAAGSDGSGWISFDNYGLVREIGMVALAVILFEGALRSGFTEIRPVLGPALRLALGATVLVAVATAVAAMALFRRPPLEALLLGSIIASTDSAAVFGLLRGSTLSRRLVRTLEGEAGFNDPVALILVAGFGEWILHPGYGVTNLAVLAARELVVGGVVGYFVGRVAAATLGRVRLPTSGLYPVASFSVVALAFGAASIFQGSSLLAVYVAGLVLGEAALPGRQTIAAFHDGLAWTAQVGLFLVLGLLVFPANLGAVAPEGIALGLVVVLIARPLATFAATLGQGFSLPERFVLSWAGLRGAAPVVFATLPVVAGVPGSVRFFDIIFFAVIVSTVLQGVTFEPLARALDLTTIQPMLPRAFVEYGGIRRLGAELVEYPVAGDDGVVGRRLRELRLPTGITPIVVLRGDEAVPPTPATRLRAGDALHLLVPDDLSMRIPELVARLHDPDREQSIADRSAEGTGFEDSEVRGLVATAWTPGDGDPADPELVSGALVVERLRMRRDRRGALVRLEDGRYAVTGATLAVGPAELLLRYARQRLRRSPAGGEAGWWGEVAAALAA
jgi:cell volume regulation protein A